MLSNARLDSRDKRFVFEIVYGVVRRRLTLDYFIDRLLTGKKFKTNAVLRRILQIGLYQLLYLDRVPDHAAVNESVKLAKEDPETRLLAGVVNGVLRKVVSDRRAALRLPGESADLSERLSIEYSHPRWMVERWVKNFGLALPSDYLPLTMKDPIFSPTENQRSLAAAVRSGNPFSVRTSDRLPEYLLPVEKEHRARGYSCDPSRVMYGSDAVVGMGRSAYGCRKRRQNPGYLRISRRENGDAVRNRRGIWVSMRLRRQVVQDKNVR